MYCKIALLIIYNHRYDANISQLEEIYKGRFQYIFHIVPFYDGNVENVIPIYEHSHYFSGYIAQAWSHLKDDGFTHFFIVADDMMLNPVVSEWSLFDSLGISERDCFMHEFLILQERERYWPGILTAFGWNPNVKGIEVMKMLPSIEEWRKRFDMYGLPYFKIPLKRLLANPRKKDWLRMLRQKRDLKYPLVAGYSDIFIVTADVMEKFAQYCGIFAATRLFVEIAIPTAMVLASDHIKTNKDVKLKGGAMWDDGDFLILKPYNNKLANLMNEFPEDKFYLHPIKLSKWH